MKYYLQLGSRGFSVGSAGLRSGLVTPDQLVWNAAIRVDVLYDCIRNSAELK